MITFAADKKIKPVVKKSGVAVYGSTGSIGKQALEVVSLHSDKFFVSLLSARSSYQELIEQALKFKPDTVIITDEKYYNDVNDTLFPHGIKVFTGKDSLAQSVCSDDIDIVMNAIMGFEGLALTLKALECNKRIALANKESLVAAGSILMSQYKKSKAVLVPVDSELSALFQCMSGEWNNEIEKVILTASGGPFLHLPESEFHEISIEKAIQHPRWKMGEKISVDSATLINKGFEVIEIMHLFDLAPENIEVWIHPEAIVHAMVYFKDSSLKALLSSPDMKIPIQYAFSYPERWPLKIPRVKISDLQQWNFYPPDFEKFPNFNLAIQAARDGGNMPCILNAGNEIAVGAFLSGKINFNDIYKINQLCMEKMTFIKNPDLNDIIQTDRETRNFAKTLMK